MIKKCFSICLGILIMPAVMGQAPVNWSFSAKKINDKTYEVHLKARLQTGWHVYAQEQPKNFIGTATTIEFNKHPLLVFGGKTSEIGKLEKSKEDVLDTESWQYENEVDFVQRVELKTNVKTTVNGHIGYQLCTDKQCLPPAENSFSIVLD